MKRRRATPDQAAESPSTYGGDVLHLPLKQRARLFSGPTFFDVVSTAPRRARQLGEPDAMVPPPAVVAFYGFRGGAGRTLALAHVGAILAARGHRVVAIDLDVDAPGLPTVLGATVPANAEGAVHLLHEAAVRPEGQVVGAEAALLSAQLPTGSGKLLVLPAGRVSLRYLAELEELGVGLWHLRKTSPLVRLLDELSESVRPDVFLLDCRTGFNSLSASVLFHHSDLAVIFLPVSEQVWSGVEILLDAARAAKAQRGNLPELLFVPTLSPPDETGRRARERFIEKLESEYRRRVGPEPEQDDEGAPEPWLREGIHWDPRISAAGKVEPSLASTGAWSLYQPLASELTSRLGLRRVEAPRAKVEFDRDAVLRELKVPSAFAEVPSIDELIRNFVEPSDYAAAVDRSTSLVIGSKGSGKTWLWRLLVEGPGANPAVEHRPALPNDVKYLVGHAPPGAADAFCLSADAMKELEKSGKMKRNQTYKAFWILYCLSRLCREASGLAPVLQNACETGHRRLLRELLQAGEPPAFRQALGNLLSTDGIATCAETLLSQADGFLLKHGETSWCLAYDGLDTGFETGSSADWLERRTAFVSALLQVILDWRSRLRRIQMKVFLREDIFLAVEMQNRSHLDPTKHELRWRPRDIWRIALNIAVTSRSYRDMIAVLSPGVSSPWNLDEEQLAELLHPLWGEHVQRGKKAYTANYLLRRLSDAGDRLFPRTFVQLLDSAVAEERKAPRRQPDRILSHASLAKGVEKASKVRLDDLKREYVELAPYLEAMKGARAIQTEKQWQEHMTEHLKRAKVRGGLQYGPGGWLKVTERLREVGVLGPPHRKPDRANLLEVALLYRAGLNVVWRGLK